MFSISEKLQNLNSLSPAVSIPDDAPPVVVELLNRCWAKNPFERPSLKEVTRTLKAAHPNQNSNFTDNLIYRLQNYHKKLEVIINSHTEALQIEMQKNNELLSNLLPV